MLVVWLTCFIKACSLEANPIECFCVIWCAISPVFKVFDQQLKDNTQRRQFKAPKNGELPMSMPVGDIMQDSVHYSPSLLVSLQSVAAMAYLLFRRHEITPDLFHFVTCVEEDLQHMLWLFALWICYRQVIVKQDYVMACLELAIAHLLCGNFSGCLF